MSYIGLALNERIEKANKISDMVFEAIDLGECRLGVQMVGQGKAV